MRTCPMLEEIKKWPSESEKFFELIFQNKICYVDLSLPFLCSTRSHQT